MNKNWPVESTQLICVGLNHLRTPIEVREQVVFSKDRIFDALGALKSCAHINEAAIINTCNRVEVYADVQSVGGQNSVEEFFHRFHELPHHYLKPHLYNFWGKSALLQLLRVTSSLDSQIIGEPQILGQVKDAYQSAYQAGTIGPQLKGVFAKAFNTAKKVRSQTRIGHNAVSVNFAVVELCKKVFGQDHSLSCLLVGIGEMGSLCAHHFHKQGCELTIVNRNLAKARALAHTLGVRAAEIPQLEQLLSEADVVICSTSSPTYLISASAIQQAIRDRRYRPMLLIDLGVPRNIDPATQQIEQVYTYDIDDLGKIVAHNLQTRQNETVLAEGIINSEIAAFEKKLLEKQCAPIIENISSKSGQIVHEELAKLFTGAGAELSPAMKDKIAFMSQRMASKILHTPIIEIKKLQSYAKIPRQ